MRLASNLLHSLVRPGASAGPQGAAQSSATMGVDFSGLLRSARAGNVSSNRPVEPGPGVDRQLSSDQLRRIALAADHAESAGMTSALVLIDGQAVKLDVLGRQVEAVLDPRAVAVTGVDGVLAAPASSLSEEVSGQAGGGVGLAGAAGAMEQQLLAKLAASTGLRLSRSPSLSSNR